MSTDHPSRFVVTGANGDIGDAVGRVLRDAFPAATLVGTDSSDPWPARALYDEVVVVPRADAPEYLDVLADLVSSGPTDTLVVPTTEQELGTLAAHPDRLPDVLMAAPELVVRFSDKFDTARWLDAEGLPTAATWRLPDAPVAALPLVVKPCVGSGSRDIEIVRSPERFEVVRAARTGAHVAQELLEPDDAEFTCAILRHGAEVRTLQLRRVLHGGMTQRATVEHDATIEAVLLAIAEACALQGLMNVQLRLTDRGPKVFEINPRISSTVMMRHRLGFSDLPWCIAARRGRPVPVFDPPVGTRVFRMSREVVAPPC